MAGHRREAPAHQRRTVCVKCLVGASSVVGPCIAVMGLVPAACNRVDATTDGAAHDERRGNRGSSMPRGARPDRARRPPAAVSQAAMGIAVECLAPWVAMTGSQRRPVVMTACIWRRIAAAITAWAWVTVSLLFALVVRWVNRAA